MKILIQSIKNDIKLQFKYGFYFVYALLTLVYVGIIRVSPLAYRETVAMFVIFSDPALLGFFFIGAIVLLEKSERVLTYLVITPLKDWQYVASKMISLTVLSLISSIMIFAAGTGFKGNSLGLILAVVLTSILFIGIGFIAVSKFKTVNEYLLTAVGYTIFLLLPVVHTTGLLQHWGFTLFPTFGAMILIKWAFFSVSSVELLLATANIVFYILLVFGMASFLYGRYIVVEGGE